MNISNDIPVNVAPMMWAGRKKSTTGNQLSVFNFLYLPSIIIIKQCALRVFFKKPSQINNLSLGMVGELSNKRIIRASIIQENTRQAKITKDNTTQQNTTHHNTTQHNTTQHNTQQHNAT